MAPYWFSLAKTSLVSYLDLFKFSHCSNCIDDNGRISVFFPERYDGWKKLNNAVSYRTNKGGTRIAKENIWLQFNKLAPLLQKLKFDVEYASDFERYIKDFHDVVVASRDAQSITLYIHILLVY